MFLKPIIRNVRGTLDSYIYYRLCESYRDTFGCSKLRNVMGLGRMENFIKQQRTTFINRLNEIEYAALVKASSLRHQEVREIGSEHLCLETAKRLSIDHLF